MLADDGPLSSPQIEPALGPITEDRPNDGPDVDIQSPTNTERSLESSSEAASELSPSVRRPSFNLADELQNANMGDSDEETQTVLANQSATRQESPVADPGQQSSSGNIGEAAGSNGAISGRTEEEYQEETRKRLAAEERVSKLEAQLEAQQQRHEREVKAEKRKLEREIQKAEQAREADKLKFDEKFNEGDQRIKEYEAQINKYVDNVAKLEDELAKAGKSQADDAARVKLENEREELRNAIARELYPTAEAPPVTPRGLPQPGEARFLLAESEYLLDKQRPLYDALREAANYADGRGGLSPNNGVLVNSFRQYLGEMNDFLEAGMARPRHCLLEARRDWGVMAQSDTW